MANQQDILHITILKLEINEEIILQSNIDAEYIGKSCIHEMGNPHILHEKHEIYLDDYQYIQILIKQPQNIFNPNLNLNIDTYSGSITLYTEIFRNVSSGIYDQWFSLYDQTKNDLYDGEIGINDERKPRILLRFNLRKANSFETSRILKENNNIQNISFDNSLFTPIKKDTTIIGLANLANDMKNSKENDNSLYTCQSKTSKIMDRLNQTVCIEYKTPGESSVNDENMYMKSINKSLNMVKRGKIKPDESSSPLRKFSNIKSNNIDANDEVKGDINDTNNIGNGNDDNDDNVEDECGSLSRYKVSDNIEDSDLNGHNSSINAQSIMLERNDYSGLLQPSLSLCNSNRELDGIQIMKKDYENGLALYTSKILEANEVARSAKILRDAIFLKSQEADVYTKSQRKIQESNIKKFVNENMKLKERVAELEHEIESLKINSRLNIKQPDESQIEIKRQKNTIQNLEAIISDLKSQYQITKNLYTSELNSKVKNVEKNKEIVEKYQETMLENSRLQEELKKLLIRYDEDISLLKKELEAKTSSSSSAIGGGGGWLSPSSSSSISSKGILVTSKENEQNELIQNLKDEFTKQKQLKDGHIMRLYDELKIIQDEKNILESQLIHLKNIFHMLANENHHLKKFDLASVLAKAEEEIIQELQILKNESKAIDLTTLLTKFSLLLKSKFTEVKASSNFTISNNSFSNKDLNTIDPKNLSLLDQCLISSTTIPSDNDYTTLHTNNDNNNIDHRLNPFSDTRLLLQETKISTELEELKRQNKSLEYERDNLKHELSRTNENFIKLTNKYIELTDILAMHKKSKTSSIMKSTTFNQSTIPIRSTTPIRSMKNPLKSSRNNSNNKNSTSTSPISSRNESYNHHQNQQQHQQHYLRHNSTANLLSNINTANISTNAPDNEDIDTKLKNFLTQYKLLPHTFLKIDKGLYLFQSKKYNLKLLNGKLAVRIGGGGYIPLLDFLKTNKVIMEVKSNGYYMPLQEIAIEIDEKPLDLEQSLEDNNPNNNNNNCLTATFARYEAQFKDNMMMIKNDGSKSFIKNGLEKVVKEGLVMENNNMQDKVENRQEGLEMMEERVKSMQEGMKNMQMGLGNMHEGSKIVQEMMKTTQDGLKNAQEVMKNMQEGSIITQEVMKTSQDAIKTTQDVMKTSLDMMKTTQDMMKTTQDVMKTSQDVMKTTQEIPKAIIPELSNTKQIKEKDSKSNFKKRMENLSKSIEKKQGNQVLYNTTTNLASNNINIHIPKPKSIREISPLLVKKTQKKTRE